MNTKDAAHNSLWQTSDVIFGVVVLISGVLELFIPLSLPEVFPNLVRIGLGTLVVLLGIRLIIISKRQFAQYGQPSAPGKPTSHLIMTGVFAISRNPLYLGLIVVQLGFGLALDWMWLLIFIIPTMIIVHYVLIVPEERYLLTKFGEDYQRYAQSVRRWL